MYSELGEGPDMDGPCNSPQNPRLPLLRTQAPKAVRVTSTLSEVTLSGLCTGLARPTQHPNKSSPN